MAFAVAGGANETEVSDFHISSDVGVGSVCARFIPLGAHGTMCQKRDRKTTELTAR